MKKKSRNKTKVKQATKMPVALAGVVILLSLVIVFFVRHFFSSTPQIAPQKKAAENLLTIDEYKSIDKELEEIVEGENPGAALVTLRGLMNEDPRVLKECHSFVHEIGHHAIEKYKDIANVLGYQDDLCGSGYTHGIIEEYLENLPDPLSAMQTLCLQYGLSEQAGKCYHGVGHGLMYFTENNLPQAVSLCHEFSDIFAQAKCAEGVYMENFSTLRSVHTSKYLDPKDSLYPCLLQPADLRQACYYYSPIYYLNLHDEDYTGALKVCLKTEKGYEAVCSKGVGSRMIKENITKPSLMVNLCRKIRSDQFSPCLDGIVSYFLVNYNSISKAKDMCELLDEREKQACLGSIERQRDLAAFE